jgi:hypothetical protein
MVAHKKKRVIPMKYNLRNIVLASMILALAQLGWGYTPGQITYQGVLKDASGDIVADGPYTIIFRLYDVESGGTDIGWSETHSVTTTDGVFSVVLGDAAAGGQSFSGGGVALFDAPHWLELELGGTALTPRTRLTAVPYAMATRRLAGSWNELGSRSRLGINVVGNADTTKAVVITQEGRIGIGTTLPERKLHIVAQQGDGIQLTDSLSGTYRASLINYENSGGSLILDDATGAIQARIGGYAYNGVQAYLLAGRVGIGTVSPDRALHVHSDSSTYIKVSGDVGAPYNYSGLALNAVSDNRAWNLVHRSQGTSQNNFSIQEWAGGSSFYYRFNITPGGNVGIGTEEPSATLDVEGSIEADTLRLATANTRWQAIPALAFAPATHTVNYTRTAAYILPTWGAASFYAPINLPQGAVIKGLLVTVKDDSASHEIGFQLSRVDFSTGTSTDLGGLTSAGESAVVVLNRGYSIAVDNSSYGYAIRVDYEATGTEAAYCFYGARVQYEITSPLP